MRDEQFLDKLSEEINSTSTKKGFWESPSPFLMQLNLKLLLIVSEAIEAMNVLRTPYEDPKVVGEMSLFQAEEFFEELADIVIRTFDLAGQFDWDFGDVILHKMEKNANRPHRHGKAF